MKLSVVILNYNVRYFLQQCLYSVTRAITDIDAEIIVIDNNSQDDSCRMVKELFPTITLIENKENVGFSKANNQAVSIAKGEYVCILNPDTAVAEDTLIKTLAFAENKSNLGAVGVHLFDGTGKFLPESKRNIPTPRVSLEKILGKGDSYYALDLSPEETGEVPVLVGAFMVLKKSVYTEIGGFDEDYFMYGEDIDFSYKITQAGYHNYYLGSVKVLHYKGESTQKDATYLDRFYGAMKIFYKKHFNQNFLLEKAVSAGVFFAKQRAKLRKGNDRQQDKEPNQVLVLTQNKLLKPQLTELFKKEVLLITKANLKSHYTQTCFVMDAEYLSYSEIFILFKNYSGNQNTFRIVPPNSRFVIGSDYSDRKGQVLVLPEEDKA